MAKIPLKKYTGSLLGTVSCRQRLSEDDKCRLIFQGRYGIHESLRLLGFSDDDKVLLPAYHCVSMVAPVTAYGCRLGFYPVSGSLQVSEKDLERAIGEDVKCVVLVHYFGIPQRRAEPIRNFLRERGIALIEDCCHAASDANGDIGSYGDLVLFSPRKYLGLIDGAVLKSNAGDIAFKGITGFPPLMTALKTYKNNMELFISLPTIHGVTGLISGKQQAPVQPKDTACAGDAIHSRRLFDDRLIAASPSRVTRWLITHIDFSKVIDRRTENFNCLQDRLYNKAGFDPPEFLKDSGTSSLLGFPVLLKERRRVAQRLKKAKLNVFTFGDPLHPLCPEDQKIALNVYTNNLLFLPVEQWLCRKDMEAVADLVEEAVLQDNLRNP